jgi:nucleotide-binding universal stress UspA family protein
MLIGSNAEEVLLSVRYPTLTVGRHVPAGVGPEIAFEQILYITDFTPESAAAAPYALALSHDFNARLEICHLQPVHPVSQEEETQAEEQYCEAVRRVIPGSEASWCSPGAQLAHGVKADEILERARRDSTGLIVLGVKAESQFARHLHTSLAFQLVATATCPVLSLRG